MYFDVESLLVELADPNAKCRRIVFETNDETLVRAACLRLNLKRGDFNIFKVPTGQAVGTAPKKTVRTSIDP